MNDRVSNAFKNAAGFMWEEFKYVAGIYFAPLRPSFWRNPRQFIKDHTAPRP